MIVTYVITLLHIFELIPVEKKLPSNAALVLWEIKTGGELIDPKEEEPRTSEVALVALEVTPSREVEVSAIELNPD